jgi:hypothetical protein
MDMEHETNAAPERRRRSGGFFWGLAVGLLGTLAVTAAGDLGWLSLPVFPGRSVAAETAEAGNRTTSTAAVYLAGTLPEGLQVYVDGKAAAPAAQGSGSLLTVDRNARRLEVRGARGPLWATKLSLQGDSPDTLRPLLGGDVVTEVSRQGPTGALYVDGVLSGTAPGTVADVAPGWHVVSVRDGQQVLFEDACVVRSGQVTLVTVPPVPPQGKGRIATRSRVLGDDGLTEVDGNPVSVDGAPAGVTPSELTLPAGFHSVRVECAGYPPRVSVVYLEAGRSLYVNADFGGEEGLQISVAPPAEAAARGPVAIPVRVEASGESVDLSQGALYVVRPGQARPMSVPLVASATDSKLWVAVLPEDLTAWRRTLTGYASGVDAQGRRGESEIFQLDLR